MARRTTRRTRTRSRRARALSPSHVKGWITRRKNAAARARTRKRAPPKKKTPKRPPPKKKPPKRKPPGKKKTPPKRAPYKNLDDFISHYEEWEGDYETFDVETNAQYPPD